MANGIIQRSYYDAAQRGRQDAQNEQINTLKTQFLRNDLEQENVLRGLMRDPNTTPEQFARQGATGIANTVQGLQPDRAAQAKEFATQMKMATEYASRVPPGQTKQFIERNFPFLAETYGPEWATATDEQVRQELTGIGARYGVQAGIAPPAQEATFEQIQGPNGSTIVKRGDKWQIIEPPKAEKPPAAFRPMRPEEIAAAGLPPGTAAQVNDSTGQISVLSKRDATSGLSQKDQVIAKQKLTTVSLARQQLQNIQQRFNAIKDTMVAGGGGQGSLPTPKGQAFDRAVDQMRSTLTALTRVPGVGAMSDFETKLDQAKFPSRSDYEEVTQQQIDDIAMMLQTIDEGYRGLLSGAPAEQQQPEAPDVSGLSDEELLRALSGG